MQAPSENWTSLMQPPTSSWNSSMQPIIFVSQYDMIQHQCFPPSYMQSKPINSHVAPLLLPSPRIPPLSTQFFPQPHQHVSPRPSPPQPQAFLLAPIVSTYQEWFPNSGSSHHVTHDTTNLMEHMIGYLQ